MPSSQLATFPSQPISSVSSPSTVYVMGMKVDEVGQAIACINLETADLFVAVRSCDLLSDCLGGLKGA